MSWKDLRDTDFGVLESLAAAWGRYASAMTGQAEVLAEDVSRKHLGVDNFDSDTADEVRRQLGLIADSFQDELHECARVKFGSVLEDAHGALAAEQSELAGVVSGIEDRGFEIAGEPAHYRVVLSEGLRASIHCLEPPAWLAAKTGIGAGDIAASTDHLNQLIRPLESVARAEAEAHGAWLRAVMSRAHEADDAAAAVLDSLGEEPIALPPRFGETYGSLVESYLEADAARHVEFLKGVAAGDPPVAPAAVNAWWNGLSSAERDLLAREHPLLVGPVDGIPSRVRDGANRVLLDEDIALLDGRLAYLDERARDVLAQDSPDANYGDLRSEYEQLRQRRDELAELRGRIDEPFDGTGQPYYLLGYDSGGDGRAIVSIGDPDTARNVNVYVPGTGADLASLCDRGGIMSRAETMAFDAHDTDRDAATATVMWLGHDAPDNVFPLVGGGPRPEAASDGHARAAAADLGSFTEGIRATGEGQPANLTLTGHSYGSTTIGVAAREAGLEADNMIFVASPGVGVETADQLGIDSERVWASRNRADIIELGMVHGADPTSVSFGGNTFPSDATREGRVANHSAYWDDGNAAREHMALIVTGRGGSGG